MAGMGHFRPIHPVLLAAPCPLRPESGLEAGVAFALYAARALDLFSIIYPDELPIRFDPLTPLTKFRFFPSGRKA
jgi:hypothetical protein